MKTLITYFSAQGTTAKVAKELAAMTGTDLFEIRPEKPYTAADLKWTNPLARCNREMLGRRNVPVEGRIADFDQYDTILIGFPIWYGAAPNVINTFCKGYHSCIIPAGMHLETHSSVRKRFRPNCRAPEAGSKSDPSAARRR